MKKFNVLSVCLCLLAFGIMLASCDLDFLGNDEGDGDSITGTTSSSVVGTWTGTDYYGNLYTLTLNSNSSCTIKVDSESVNGNYTVSGNSIRCNFSNGYSVEGTVSGNKIYFDDVTFTKSGTDTTQPTQPTQPTEPTQPSQPSQPSKPTNPPDPPRSVSAEYVEGLYYFRISWRSYDDVDYYEVWHHKYSMTTLNYLQTGGTVDDEEFFHNFRLIGTFDDTGCIHTNIDTVRHYYKIVAVNAAGKSKPSEAALGLMSTKDYNLLK